MSKHTPEPWFVFFHAGRAPRTSAVIEIQDAQGLPIASWLGFDDSRRPEAEHLANARRIFACVNGCKGTNPEAVPDLLEALKVCLRELNWCVDGMGRKGGEYEMARDRARAAIAKAEED